MCFISDNYAVQSISNHCPFTKMYLCFMCVLHLAPIHIGPPNDLSRVLKNWWIECARTSSLLNECDISLWPIPSFLRKWLEVWWTWSRDAGGSWSERILMIRGKKCYSLHNGGNHLTVPRLEILAHGTTDQKEYGDGLQHLTIINLMYIYYRILCLVFWQLC